MAEKIEVEVEVKANPEKFWGAIRDSEKIFPKAFPQQYKSIEVLEGDGKSVGSIRLVKYAEGIPLIQTSKEKIETVDEVNKTVSYSIIEGEILNYYKSFKAQIEVGPKGEGSLVKWSCHFEKAKEETPQPDVLKEFALSNFKELDALLAKA